jgi:hypothetical protein
MNAETTTREEQQMLILGYKLAQLLRLKQCKDPHTGQNYIMPRFEIEGGNKTHVGLARTILKVIADHNEEQTL